MKMRWYKIMIMLLALLQLCSGTETLCDARDNITTVCSTTTGQSLHLHLITEGHNYHGNLRNMTTILFKWKHNQTSFTEKASQSMKERWLFVVENGTMIIKQTQILDSGQYILSINDAKGGGQPSKNIILIIEDLEGTAIPSIAESSSVSPTEPGQPPEEHWMSGILFISFGAILAFLVVSLAVGLCCIRKRRRPANEAHLADSGPEPQYAVVSILAAKESQKRRPRTEEDEVEYCQVQVSAGPRRTTHKR